MSASAMSAVKRFEKSLGAIRSLATVPAPEQEDDGATVPAPASSFLEQGNDGESLLERAMAGDVRGPLG